MGEFTYCGIQQGLERCINPEAHQTNGIDLQFHCDGLNNSKSSKSDIWPILCKVYSRSAKYKPFVVAMYHGQSKPNDVNNYLAEFVLEINELLENGVNIAGRYYSIHIQCLIADTPARVFLKNIQGHTGKHGCERCTAIGEPSQNQNDVDELSQSQRRRTKKSIIVFPRIGDNDRTDASFREFRDYHLRI
ncbi:uncharacterized protein LOC122850466 [Aphidius gifuensis]|uniref:uncharacterized protein LOC122850466 n=1 Tax=Aphidius gifuensis TaxID=684658 RepID=UPI001CDC767E|nr:uncharacterized protein LOC122850466 [Aphidius gifuensis]